VASKLLDRRAGEQIMPEWLGSRARARTTGAVLPALLSVGWRLAAELDQVPGERQAIAIGMKRLAAVPEQRGDALEVIKQGQFPGWVVPLA
jgi:hypothetical protein